MVTKDALRQLVREGVEDALPCMAIFLLHPSSQKAFQSKLVFQDWANRARAALAKATGQVRTPEGDAPKISNEQSPHD